ncbi:MAG: DNA adenine methylase [Cyanobacteriota bacterium]
MKIPHLVQYQGSKRNIASEIIKCFPEKFSRLIEPFAGTAAISIATAKINSESTFILNDLNKPLAKLLKLIISNPEYVFNEYEKIWNEQHNESLEHYYQIREKFNREKDPVLFLYLLARCVKGAVRYNSNGCFNQSPDKRRKGTRPETMKKNILGIYSLLKDRTQFYSMDYKNILSMAKKGDLIYLDPPYQGVCGERDSRYFAGIEHNEFIEEIKKLNEKEIDFIISYDGTCGNKSYGKKLPEDLDLIHTGLKAGRSTQATLLGKNEFTIESIYLSKLLSPHNNLILQTA